jgi:small subunit ribosomal protein S17
MTDKADNAENKSKLHMVTGRVVSNKMDKTVSVAVERIVKHPVYGKYLRRTSKYFAHDEENTCQQGDVVTIQECRPLSKNKSWRLIEVIERANAE